VLFKIDGGKKPEKPEAGSTMKAVDASAGSSSLSLQL
jgi:hypothetical protein